jgi:hypothetical protein
MSQYLKVQFTNCDFAVDEYLQWVKDLIEEDYRRGGFDGFKPTITIEDDNS